MTAATATAAVVDALRRLALAGAKSAIPLVAAGLASSGGAGVSAVPAFTAYESSGATPRFALDRPDWKPRSSGNPFNVLSLIRPDSQCYFDLDAGETAFDRFQGFVHKFVKDQGASIVSSNPLSYEFRTPDGKYTFLARTRGTQCGGKSYLVTLTCLREGFDQSVADRVFSSMQCGGIAVTAASPAAATAAPAPAPPLAAPLAARAQAAKGNALDLRLERLKPGVAFRVVVTAPGEALSDALPTIVSSRGRVSSIARNKDGSYSATVEPDAAGTGEYRVSVTLGELSIARTAVVLKGVGERWGQPQAVECLVNTPGWEDSIYVTPDGEWLFLAYSPVSITCTWKHDHPRHGEFCERALGPWSGPSRPGFIGTERITKEGRVSPHCLGIKPPFAIPPFATYGFRRQPDGSFAAPFQIGVAGSGGCIVPGGLNVYPRADGSAHLLYLWNEYWDERRRGATYSTAEVPKLGTDFILGTWEGSYGTGGTVKGYRGSALDIPGPRERFGHNAHGHMEASGQIRHLLFDHESGAREVYVTTVAPKGTYPRGPWSPPRKISGPVSSGQETMPFFDGRRLTVRRDHSIATAEFRGRPDADLADGRAWSEYAADLIPDTAAWHAPGAIFTLGEPTRTDPALTAGGKEILYFNYAVRASDGSTNLNVGFVVAGN